MSIIYFALASNAWNLTGAIRARERQINNLCTSNVTPLQGLRRTLRRQGNARKALEFSCSRAQAETARVHRYVNSVLQVNENLVGSLQDEQVEKATETNALLVRARQTKASTRTRGKPRARRRNVRHPDREENEWQCASIDTSAAVRQVLEAARAGGNPVRHLQALYERIGFCALKGGGAYDAVVLPTSSTNYKPRNDDMLGEEKEAKCSSRSTRTSTSAMCCRFEEGYPHRMPSSALRQHSKRRSEGVRDKGSRKACIRDGWVLPASSFAHSPPPRRMSGAEKWPQVAQRLEALAEKLEREKVEVERWYKTVVHNVGCAHWLSLFYVAPI